jgi:hypothetical protein
MLKEIIMKTAIAEDITKKIYTIRNYQVMLDKDLAVLYQIETRALKQAVKRNSKRFPEDFMFILNEAEIENLVSQSVIPSRKSLGGSKPYVFTEQGVASLSGVLTSDKAVAIHIQIMRTFVHMRQFIQKNAFLLQKINAVASAQQIFQLETDQKFKQVFDALENYSDIPTQGIFFNGQIFDAYCFISDLIRSAKRSIILIDNYVDDTVLTLLAKRKTKVSAIIYTKKITKHLALDVKKHNDQYSAIEIRERGGFHDRFLILDEDRIYHIGASLKDLGNKWFAFSKIEKDALKVLEKLRKNK